MCRALLHPIKEIHHSDYFKEQLAKVGGIFHGILFIYVRVCELLVLRSLFPVVNLQAMFFRTKTQWNSCFSLISHHRGTDILHPRPTVVSSILTNGSQWLSTSLNLFTCFAIKNDTAQWAPQKSFIFPEAWKVSGQPAVLRYTFSRLSLDLIRRSNHEKFHLCCYQSVIDNDIIALSFCRSLDIAKCNRTRLVK